MRLLSITIASVLWCSPLAAQTSSQTRNEGYLVEAANAALGLMSFAVVPDVTTSTLNIKRDDGNTTDLTLTQFGGGATISDEVPIYLEGTASYARYDPGLIIKEAGLSKYVPLKWNSFSLSGGIGYDFQVAPNWVLRPIANIALGTVISDVDFIEWWINDHLGTNFDFDTGRLNAYGYGGSLMLDYELFSPRHDIDAEFRYSYIRLESFGSTSNGARGKANAENFGIYLRRRVPTGIMLFERPLRWVTEGAHTQFLGEQRGALGFSYITSLGAGIEFDTSKYPVFVTRTRLVGRYMFSPTTEGYSIGLAMSF